jgi:hypothetical protein
MATNSQSLVNISLMWLMSGDIRNTTFEPQAKLAHHQSVRASACACVRLLRRGFVGLLDTGAAPLSWP